MTSVIATILLVVICVAAAAAAYAFFGTIQQEPQRSEAAALRATAFDTNNDGHTDWIKLLLAHGEHAPYGPATIQVTLLAPGGASLVSSDTTAILCNEPSAATGASPLDQACATDADNFLHASSSLTEWPEGASLWIPCQDTTTSKIHQLTISVRDTTVLDAKIVCDQAAP